MDTKWKSLFLAFSLCLSLLARAGGGEFSGGGNGFVTEMRSIPHVKALPILSSGEKYLPFGIDLVGSRKKLWLFDLEENATSFHFLFSVFPYKPLTWNDPAQKDARLLNVCRSLALPTEGPHCWALINKIAQIRLVEPDFAEYLLEGMGKFKWVLSEDPPRTRDQGPLVTEETQKKLLQIARRDGGVIQVSRPALHGGFADVDALAYADFVGLILHEVIYGQMPWLEDSLYVRLIVSKLFTLHCPSLGRVPTLTRGKKVTWICGAADLRGPDEIQKPYEFIQRVWSVLVDIQKGRSSDPKVKFPKPKFKTKLSRQGIVRDLLRFALLQELNIAFMRDGQVYENDILSLIDQPFSNRKMSTRFYHTDHVSWIIVANALTEGFLGSSVYIHGDWEKEPDLKTYADLVLSTLVSGDNIQYSKSRRRR